MKFPKVIKHRKAEVTIYGKKKSYPFYRLAYRVNGKRRMKHFATYGEAKTAADKKVRELSEGSQVAALTAGQARDALAAFDRLNEYHQKTGHRISLLVAASECVEALIKLNGRTVREAVTGFLSTVASVKRKDILEAVDEFIAADEPRTRASEGQRAQLSAKYAYNRAIMLRRFANALPGHAVCDLSKQHLNVFFTSKPVSAFSSKSRNHHRAAIKQFLQSCVRQDYLPVTHRLNETDAMRPEHSNHAETEFYTAKELLALLTTAEAEMKAMVAIGGLAGLRSAELLRLTWEDVWRVPQHIEITAGKSKTRQRRLVEICPALAAWLRPYRKSTGKLCTLHEITWQQHFLQLCTDAGVTRKSNGLRHAFCTYHFAANGNENQTAQQAGNSPAMVHQHYKGLATKAEGKKWFSVKPTQNSNVISLPTASRKQAQ
ncbi:MAG: tyrosine-type recombinase/integrase [Verrucomicrobiota bacterium]